MNRMDRFGVELEGGWNTAPEGLYGDGSVRDLFTHHMGEVQHTSVYSEDGIRDMEQWMTANYPAEVNSRCGFHIHVSFLNTMYYVQVFNPKFYQFYLAHMTKLCGTLQDGTDKVRFAERLNGRNHYCQKGFNAMQQYMEAGKGGQRYFHLNYCYGLHGTLENRLFPMFKKSEVAISSMKYYLNVIEQWFDKHAKKREERYNLVVPFSPGSEENLVIKEVICV